MNCLTNYIGLKRGCDPVPPKSGLYIDDLEGLSLNNITSINDGKYITAQEMVASKLALASEVMQQEFMMSMVDIWQMQVVLESGIGGVYGANYVTADPVEQGLSVKMVNSNLRVVTLDSLILDFENDFAKAITVTDGVTTMVINEGLEVISVAGSRTEIPINFVSSNGIIKATYDGTGLIGREGSTKESYFRKDCSRCGKPGYESFTIRGLLSGAETQTINGVVARVNVDCSMDKAFCLSLHYLKMALLYRLGVELLKEWEASSRMNWMTIHGKEWAQAKRVEWEDKAMQILQTTIPQMGNFLKKVDSNCLKCGGVSYVQVHP